VTLFGDVASNPTDQNVINGWRVFRQGSHVVTHAEFIGE
ncbi:uncharacterized protein METZ01_LOCUS127436, partial [marine metagenome]